MGGGAYLQNDDLAAAIVYAADNGAQVINMSWGDTVRAFIIEDAIEYAHHRGCVPGWRGGQFGGSRFLLSCGSEIRYLRCRTWTRKTVV